MGQWIKKIIIKSPFSKGGTPFASFWQREVGRDFIRFFKPLKYYEFCKESRKSAAARVPIGLD